ncbi:MAG: hypothetical protein QOG62_1322 [Thermoleophilaceae bacterium]|jgi:UDP-glucose 4-epimerase|nr:hypothetical protein [Thermoleophilaceae bacterium]
MKRFVARQTGRKLVTGCAGFLGSQLAERLVGQGHEVIGVDCFTDFYDRSMKEQNLARLMDEPGFAFRELDLSVDPLAAVLEGVDVAYHLAGQPGVRGSFGGNMAVYLRNNVRASSRLLDEAARWPVHRIVYASSSTVYGNVGDAPTPETAGRRPLSPYGLTKVMTEDLAAIHFKRAGLPAVGLRYFSAYGPRQRPDLAMRRFIESALEDRPITITGTGNQQRDFTYVDDMLDATTAAGAVGRPGSVYNIGGGSPYRLLEVVMAIEELTGRTLEKNFVNAASGDAASTNADNTRATEDLGFAPRTSLRDGLEAQLEWTLATAAPARRLLAA